MTDTTTAGPKTTANRQLAIMRGSEAPVVQGRREYFEYKDHGVRGATNEWMRAEVISSTNGFGGHVTGWHYHPCQGQFVFVLKGWIQLAFENGSVAKLEAGDSAFIPGGYIHNEIDASNDFDVLEISLPAKLETVNVDAPAGLE